MYYVYILKSAKTGEFYKGLTDDLDRRFIEHNRGKEKTTKNKTPWILIHVEVCLSRKEARKLEKFFKSGFGREAINEIAETIV